MKTDYNGIVLAKQEDGLLIKVTSKPTFEEFLTDNKDMSDNELFVELIDDYLCNGWALIPPEGINALTDAFLLSDDTYQDDDGTYPNVGSIYSFANYCIVSEIDMLKRDGEVKFDLAN